MRSEGTLKYLGICTAILVALVILNVLILGGVRRQYAPGTATAASLFNISGQMHEWGTYITKWKRLAAENEALKSLVEKQLSTDALVRSLQAENDSLRKANGLSDRLRRDLIPAGIFDVSLTPGGHHALINKGKDDGLREGQVVISMEGILIGRISALFSSSSKVMLVTHPDFSVTVKVLDGLSSGIARGALSEGIDLDLITQSDEITEGNILVTTGNDLLPAGLIVGTVRNVQNNDTQLFKKVKVNPAMDPSQGSVAVIKQ